MSGASNPFPDGGLGNPSNPANSTNMQFLDAEAHPIESFQLPAPVVPEVESPPRIEGPTTPEVTRPEIQVRVIPVPNLGTSRLIIQMDDEDTTVECSTIPTEQVDLATIPEEDRKCSICLEPYGRTPESEMQQRSEEGPIRLQCAHILGEACVYHWFCMGNYTCPLCRSDFVTVNYAEDQQRMEPDIVLREGDRAERESIHERLINYATDLHDVYHTLRRHDLIPEQRMTAFRDAQNLNSDIRTALRAVVDSHGLIGHMFIIAIRSRFPTEFPTFRLRRVLPDGTSDSNSELWDDESSSGQEIASDEDTTVDEDTTMDEDTATEGETSSDDEQAPEVEEISEDQTPLHLFEGPLRIAARD